MVRYLVIGALLVAALQTLILRTALVLLGAGPLVSVVVLMLLAIVLSICSTVDAFVVLAFVGSFSLARAWRFWSLASWPISKAS
jgi:uncharacterized protein